MLNKFLALSLLILLGPGCASVAPADDTPNANPPNCEMSGGTIVEGFCECPEGYAPDPADFCLDASGKPGGAMAE